MLLKSFALTFLILLSGGLSASTLPFCADSTTPGPRHTCQKEWTVLIYMAADNDLTPYALLDLSEMERTITGEKNLGASGPKVDVVVELDTHMATGIRRLHMQQSAAHTLPQPFDLQYYRHMTEQELLSPVLMHEAEDSDYGRLPAHQRFQQFIQWGAQNFPSQHLMVVIWGHGEGYIGMPAEMLQSERQEDYLAWQENHSRYLTKDMLTFNLSSVAVPTRFPGKNIFGGVAFDSSDGTYLSMPQLRQALLSLEQAGSRADITAFDACLMQSVEVASELAGVTDIAVGSVQIQDYVGLPYRSLLDEINRPTTTPPAPYQLAKKLIRLTEESFRPSGYQFQQAPRARETFTLSALELNEFSRFLLPELARLSRALELYMEEDDYRLFEIGFLLKHSPKFLGESRELGIFLGSLKKLLYQERQEQHNSDFTPQARALLTQIDRTLDGLQRSLLDYAYGDAYINSPAGSDQAYLLGFFKGVSLWLPDSTKLFDMRYNEFAKSALFRYELKQDDGNLLWRQWLEKVLGGKGPLF